MKKNLIKIFCLIMMLIVGLKTTYAASFSISVGAKNLTKGGSTTLTITGSDVTGRFNVSTSNSSVISISEDRTWIENDTYRITLSALSVGSATITVTPNGVSDSSGNSVSLGAKSVKITVSLPREKSANNNLKSLSVEGYDLIPTFDKDTLEYNVVVPSTVEKINISAAKADNYASLSGTGEFAVLEGANSFEVKVTSETGAEKVYLIVVTVEDLNPITVNVENKQYTLVKVLKNLTKPEFYTETTTIIEGIDIPSFYNDRTKYTLVGLKDEAGNIALFKYEDNKYTKYIEIISNNLHIAPLGITSLIDGYISNRIKINEEEIPVMMVTKKSKFALIYGINVETGVKSYFKYDLTNKTIQEYDNELEQTLTKKLDIYTYIIFGAGGLALLELVLIIYLLVKNTKKTKLIKKYLADKNIKLDSKEEKKSKKDKRKEKDIIKDIMED